MVHSLLQHVLLGSSSVKSSGKDIHSNQDPSDKHDNRRPVHARSYPDTTNRVNYDRACLDFQLNGKTVLSDDVASNTLRITKGSFVRGHESTQSLHSSSWWHDISNDRMTEDKATDPAKTSLNKNTSNDIKVGKTKELSTVDEQADSSELCKNVTNLEIVVCVANETYFVISNNIRALLEILLSTSVKSFLMGSRFLDSLEEGSTTLVISLTFDLPAFVPFVIRIPSF